MENWAGESPLIFVGGLPLLVKRIPHLVKKLPLLVKQVPPAWILPTGGSTKRSSSLMAGKTDLSDEEILERAS